MPLDPYAPCPGGTGKKLKFCCADLAGDLEQLDRLTEGQQYAAALDQADRLNRQYPGRACLLASRTRLQLATKRFAEAAAGSKEFVEAFPENPVALGQAAVMEAIGGRLQESLALFDKAREKALEAADTAMPLDLVRTGQTLVQLAAQAGHPLAAQGILEWMIDASLGSEQERQVLASVVASAGVPVALRTKVPLEAAAVDSPYRFEIDAAVKHAREWRLGTALSALHGLKPVAGECAEVFTNIAVLCEMLARPYEASEAWLSVAKLRNARHDDAVEATGRAIAMETESDPDRSPVVRMTSMVAPLPALSGDAAGGGLELLEDKLRHAGRFDPAPIDRSGWVARNAVPPHSVWRVYSESPATTTGAPSAAAPERLLATLLIFSRQTDREPEAVLQGFEPDVAEARPAVETLLGAVFTPPPEAALAGMPVVSPTAWLLNTQFRVRKADLSQESPAADAASPIDRLLARQRQAIHDRFLSAWPDTPLPELLGKTPRQAAGERGQEAARRVEALVAEGEAASRQPDVSALWTAVRAGLGLPAAASIRSPDPLAEVPPLRWHRLAFEALPLDQLRPLFLTALDAGFDLAATRAAEAIVARPDATPEDRWEAYGVLEDRAATSLEKLGIIAHLRDLAKKLGVSDGMLDVAELRVLLSRADEAGIMRLLNHLQREHGRDQKVLAALAEVLAEAGIDLAALAARSAAAPGGGLPIGGGAAAPESGRIWTPGGEPAGPTAPGGEKKSIWTPG